MAHDLCLCVEALPVDAGAGQGEAGGMKWFALFSAFSAGAGSAIGLAYWVDRGRKLEAMFAWIYSAAWLAIAIWRAVLL